MHFFMPISTTNKKQTNRSFPELGYCIQKNTVHRPCTISLSGLLTKKIPVWQRECWVGVTVHSRGALLNSKTAPCGTFFDSTYYLCHALSSALWALWLTWTPSNLCSADADTVLQKSNLEACSILYLKSSCVLTFIWLFTLNVTFNFLGWLLLLILFLASNLIKLELVLEFWLLHLIYSL